MERWRVMNVDDVSQFFEGSVEECNRWASQQAKEGKLKMTGWSEISEQTGLPKTIAEMQVQTKIDNGTTDNGYKG